MEALWDGDKVVAHIPRVRQLEEDNAYLERDLQEARERIQQLEEALLAAREYISELEGALDELRGKVEYYEALVGE